ncbi:MAG TPA: DUF1573 domain-containing protein [Spirochaetota bacterium]|nr:DUF1573 domain-containing protein [Spirochaetota bacterium]HPI89495.1 DUF1573 domain-containing protein [Spirochaetota bacterium]HPR49568.1 DUF1573 domain-containing protein [Spirochaetota bacterium]
MNTKRLVYAVFLIMLPLMLWSKPEIHFDQIKHDFGTVQPNSELLYVFEFANTGKDTLHIKDIKAG